VGSAVRQQQPELGAETQRPAQHLVLETLPGSSDRPRGGRLRRRSRSRCALRDCRMRPGSLR
jgi:hypothetical protein